ncbi:hypothetical protein TW83_10015 [Paracoccus sp. S4493]|nr:hypothetical protein TW83_10015 [Paracoccus sp. S4493]
MGGKGGKKGQPVPDWHMTLHYGIALEPSDALFGVRIGDKLAWPPAQVDEDGSVERCPSGIDYLAINRGRPISEAIDPAHKEIMTSQRNELIDEPDLFGGDETGGGGVHGIMSWMPGAADQVPPAYVDEKAGYAPGKGPGYRGFSSAFFTGARKTLKLRDAMGLFIGVNSLPTAFKKRGFLWSSNNPIQPGPQFRHMRYPRAKPLSDWCDSVAEMGDAAVVSERNILIMPGPLDPARRDSDGDLMRSGGGFPRANPAAVLYELYATGGYETEPNHEVMDAETFLTGARIFSKEGIGISSHDANVQGFNAVAEKIFAHAGCRVILDRRTGRYTMRVLRHQSVFQSLWSGRPAPRPEISDFVLTPSNGKITSEVKSRMPSELVSSLTVKFTVDETEETGVVNLISQAAIAISGGANDESRDFSMFRDSQAAITAGKRELAMSSTPMVTFEASMSRHAWDVCLFDVISVDWPSEPAIHGRRFLVAEISYGDVRDREIVASLAEYVADVTHPDDVQISTVAQAPRYGSMTVAPKVDFHYPTPMSAPMLIASGVPMDAVLTMDDEEVTEFAHLISAQSNLDAIEVFQHPQGTQPADTGTFIEPTPRAVMVDSLPGGEATSSFVFYDLDFGAQAADVDVGDKLIFVRRAIPGVTNNPIVDVFQSGNSGVLSISGDARKYALNESSESITSAVGSAALALDPESDTHASGYGLRPYYCEEIAIITDVDRETGVVTIKRGIHDTSPAQISAGTSIVYHLKRGSPVLSAGEMAVVSGGSQATVLRPVNAGQPSKKRVNGALINPVRSLGYSRATLPARPGAATISANGQTVSFAAGKLVLEEPAPVTLTWSPRNRMLDDAVPAAWDQGPVTPEEEALYYVRLFRRIRARKGRQLTQNNPYLGIIMQGIPSTSNLVKTYRGIAETTFTIPVEDILMDMSDPNSMRGSGNYSAPTDIFGGAAYAVEIGTYRGEISANASAPASFQNPILLFDVAVDATGYGLAYGKDYGGQ